MKGIPFIVFDVGGVLEMFDYKLHRENVVLDPTIDALTARVKGRQHLLASIAVCALLFIGADPDSLILPFWYLRVKT